MEMLTDGHIVLEKVSVTLGVAPQRWALSLHQCMGRDGVNRLTFAIRGGL